MFSNGGKRLFSELVPEKGQQRPFKENQVKSMLSVPLDFLLALCGSMKKDLLYLNFFARIKSYMNGICVVS